jgi:hypothetical protein
LSAVTEGASARRPDFFKMRIWINVTFNVTNECENVDTSCSELKLTTASFHKYFFGVN